MHEEIDWKSKYLAAEAELAALRSRPKAGRPRSEAVTPDAKLIAKAIKTCGLTLGELAAKLDVSSAVLSRANETPIAQHHRDTLAAMIAKALAVAKPAVKKSGSRKARA